MDYRIYVVTRGTSSQLTLERLPRGILYRTTVVVPSDTVHVLKERLEELGLSNSKLTILVQPDKITGICEKRSWIIKQSKEDYVIFMNDNIMFSVFDPDTGKHISTKNASPELVKDFFIKKLPKLMNDYKVMGFGAKYFAQLGGIKENYHLGYVYGFHRSVFSDKKKLIMGRISIYEDIDYTLQVLRNGIRIGVTYDMVCSPKLLTIPGNGSKERSFEHADECARKLKEFHPGIIKDKEKSSKSANAEPFTTIRVQWRKAAIEGHVYP